MRALGVRDRAKDAGPQLPAPRPLPCPSAAATPPSPGSCCFASPKDRAVRLLWDRFVRGRRPTGTGAVTAPSSAPSTSLPPVLMSLRLSRRICPSPSAWDPWRAPRPSCTPCPPCWNLRGKKRETAGGQGREESPRQSGSPRLPQGQPPVHSSGPRRGLSASQIKGHPKSPPRVLQEPQSMAGLLHLVLSWESHLTTKVFVNRWSPRAYLALTFWNYGFFYLLFPETHTHTLSFPSHYREAFTLHSWVFKYEGFNLSKSQEMRYFKLST